MKLVIFNDVVYLNISKAISMINCSYSYKQIQKEKLFDKVSQVNKVVNEKGFYSDDMKFISASFRTLLATRKGGCFIRYSYRVKGDNVFISEKPILYDDKKFYTIAINNEEPYAIIKNKSEMLVIKRDILEEVTTLKNIKKDITSDIVNINNVPNDWNVKPRHKMLITKYIMENT